MDSVSHFDDIPMRPVAEADDDSAMDVTPRVLSPSRRGSIGESATPSLWSTPLSGISGLTGGAGELVYLVFVCCFVWISMIIVAALLKVPEMNASVGN
jgi:hypothetical protein